MTRRNGRASAAVACAVMAGTWNGLAWITVDTAHPVIQGGPVRVTGSRPRKRDGYATRFRRARLADDGTVLEVEVAPDPRGAVRTYRPERITTP